MNNHSSYVEKAIIGCVLLKGGLYEKIMGRLSIEDFTDVLYQKIWRILGKFYENQVAIDIIIIDDYAHKNNISGIELSILKDIQAFVLHNKPVPLDQYIKILKRCTYDRATPMLAEEFRLGKITAEKLREELNNIKPPSEIKKETNEDIILATIADAEKGADFKFPSNFKRLNEITGGFDRGDLIIIGGYPSSGKSSLATDLTCGFCGLDYSVLFITLEMSVKANMRRIEARMKEINTMKFKRGILDEEDKERIKEMIPLLNDVWDYNCIRAYNMQDIIRAEIEYQPDIVIIDYLQNISDKEGLSEYARLTKFTLQIQQIGRKKGISTILLSQFHRPEEGRVRRPRNSDFRGSGSIEERAEIIFLLYWERKLKLESLSRGYGIDPEYMIIDVTKNKDGETGQVEMKYYPEYHRWVAWDDEEDDNEVIKYIKATDVSKEAKRDSYRE